MTREQLAREIAKGIINTGVEGSFDTITCSTAGDYPSIGISQWEGPRADRLLAMIPGGDQFSGRSFSDIKAAGELYDLQNLLSSDAGETAQLERLINDCLLYVDSLWEVSDLDQSRPLIYCGIWCPTSTYVVQQFCLRRQERGYDLRSLECVYEMFRDEYANAAGCGEYQDGYANRAYATYEYVAALDLSEYGE